MGCDFLIINRLSGKIFLLTISLLSKMMQRLIYLSSFLHRVVLVPIAIGIKTGQVADVFNK